MRKFLFYFLFLHISVCGWAGFFWLLHFSVWMNLWYRGCGCSLWCSHSQSKAFVLIAALFCVWMNRVLDWRAQRVYAGVVCVQHGAQEQLPLLLLLRWHVQPQLHWWLWPHCSHHNALHTQWVSVAELLYGLTLLYTYRWHQSASLCWDILCLGVCL